MKQIESLPDSSSIVPALGVDVKSLLNLSNDQFLSLLNVQQNGTKVPTEHAIKLTYILDSGSLSKNPTMSIYVLYGEYAPEHKSNLFAYYKVNKVSGEIIEYQKYDQKEQYLTVNGVQKPLKLSKMHQYFPPLNEDMIAVLSALSQTLEEYMKVPFKAFVIVNEKNSLLLHKIEYNITPTYTPEKVSIQQFKIPQDTSSKTGKTFGKIKIISKDTNLDFIPENSIIVVKTIPASLTKALKKVKGLILETDKLTIEKLHSKNIYVPTIINKEKLNFKNGEYVFLDSNKATITKLEFTPQKVNKQLSLIPNYYKDKTLVSIPSLKDPNFKEAKGIAILDGNDLAQTLLKYTIDDRKDFKQSFIYYLREVLKITENTPIYYQSIYTYSHSSGQKNGIIGSQGAHSILQDKKFFIKELETIKKLISEYNFKNINLIIPFVRTSSEMQQVKSIIHNMKLSRTSVFHLFMSINIPSNIILLEDFIAEGLDGVMFDWEKITQFLFGFDKKLDDQSFTKLINNPLVMQVLQSTLSVCKKRHVALLVTVPDTLEKKKVKELYDMGVSAIIVNTEHHNFADIEKLKNEEKTTFVYHSAL